MRRTGNVYAAVCVLLAAWLCGCQNEVGVRPATEAERRDYSSMQISGGELSDETVNLLGNYSFNEMFEEEPVRLISELSRLFVREPRGRFLAALADVSLASGRRLADKDRDLAARFFLNSAMYAYIYLAKCEQRSSVCDPAGLRMILVYNAAVSEIFGYLNDRGLLEKSGFELYGVIGGTVRFDSPSYRLPIDREQIRKIMLCADYRPQNLTHVSRSFGIGAPLIIGIDKPVREGEAGFARNQTIPGTFFLDFSVKNLAVGGEFTARVCFIDSNKTEEAECGKRKLPLARDLSTPLAYMVKDPPLFNFIDYTLLPAASKEMQGLYRFGPADDDKIPVVLVHGLLSDTRTWLQMINTLQSDEDINRNYQFLGFSYSSGNPVFHSARMLRRALQEERARMVAEKRSTEKFDRMVVIGHSMGGLLTRLLISDSSGVMNLPQGRETYAATLEKLSQEERRQLDEAVNFKPLPFVKRVVFISVPHRGSRLAQTGFARFGSSLIRLPKDVLHISQTVIEAVFGGKTTESAESDITGVGNLDPDSNALRLMAKMPMSDKVVRHSVIGNVKKGGVPGGSDGVVPYSSSHLDGVDSELVVKSGHSAQKVPLAIQEIRRILLVHLSGYSDSRISPPLLLLEHRDPAEGRP